MNGALYSSPAIRQTKHHCVDVKADATVVVIGEVTDRSTHGTHITTLKALDALISYLGEARKCLAARGAK